MFNFKKSKCLIIFEKQGMIEVMVEDDLKVNVSKSVQYPSKLTYV